MSWSGSPTLGRFITVHTSVGVTRMKQSPLLWEAATGSTSRVWQNRRPFTCTLKGLSLVRFHNCKSSVPDLHLDWIMIWVSRPESGCRHRQLDGSTVESKKAQKAVYRIRNTLMRIRIPLVSLTRIRILCHFDADLDPSFQINAQNLEKVLK